MKNIIKIQLAQVYKRFKIKEQKSSWESQDHSLYYFKNPVTNCVFNIHDFKKSLKYDDRGFVFDVYYYDVRISKTHESIHLYSFSKLNHLSFVYVKKPYRTSVGKWKTGWKVNPWGMDHRYVREPNFDALKFLKEMYNEVFICAKN